MVLRDSLADSRALFAAHLHPILGDDDDARDEVFALVRKHGFTGTRNFLRDLVQKYRSRFQEQKWDDATLRTRLRRAFFDNLFPDKYHQVRDMIETTNERIEEMRAPLPHRSSCACGGRGWLSSLVVPAPADARVIAKSPSGGLTFHCPGESAA